MLLEDVKIIRLDLYGLKRISNYIPHFVVLDRNEVPFFIRIGNSRKLDGKIHPLSKEVKEKADELEHLQVGYFVTVEVESNNWTIRDLSGTSFWYSSLKSWAPIGKKI